MPAMMSGIVALVFVLMIAGVAGSLLPIVPGTLLILLGALIYAVTPSLPTSSPSMDGDSSYSSASASPLTRWTICPALSEPRSSAVADGRCSAPSAADSLDCSSDH